MIPIVTDEEVEIIKKWMENNSHGYKIKPDCPPRERKILERIIATIEEHNK